MPVLQEEVDAVLLLGDGVVVRRVLDDIEAAHGELVSRRGALVLSHLAADPHRCFHPQRGDLREAVGAARALLRHALDPPRAVAKLEEGDLSLGPEVVQPSLDLHVGIDVFSDFRN